MTQKISRTGESRGSRERPSARRTGRRLQVLIASGPTREPIDPVRFVSNYSTGMMGRCLAEESRRRGHRVSVVSGPAHIVPPAGVRVTWVEEAHQMQDALRRQMPRADVLIMAAAVSDFAPARRAQTKLSRRDPVRLRLRATPDVVATLPRHPGQLVVGFALETASAVSRARAKAATKRLDLVVAQQFDRAHRPFGAQAVTAWLLRGSGEARRLGRLSKPALARALLDEIERLWYGGPAARQGAGRSSGRNGAGERIAHA